VTRKHEEQPAEQRHLLTVEQLAEYLQVPAQTIYAWRHEGVGPKALKARRALRFRQCDVDNWLEHNG